MFLRILIFFLCVNTGFGIVSQALGINLCKTSDVNSGCLVLPPLLAPNNTNNALNQIQSPSYAGVNLTTNTVNGSSSLGTVNTPADPFSAYWNAGVFIATLPFLLINAFSGGFIYDLLANIVGFSIQSTFLYGLKAIIAVLAIVWIWYQFSGRFASGGNV